MILVNDDKITIVKKSKSTVIKKIYKSTGLNPTYINVNDIEEGK